MTVESSQALRTRYVVWLKGANVWLGERFHWEQKRDEAKRFNTFAEADTASEGYDVVIQTVEE